MRMHTNEALRQFVVGLAFHQHPEVDDEALGGALHQVHHAARRVAAPDVHIHLEVLVAAAPPHMTDSSAAALAQC